VKTQKQHTKDFAKAVNQFAEAYGADVGKVLDLTALQLHKSIVMKTPVDTGRARGSWTIGRNQIASPGGLYLKGVRESGDRERRTFLKSGKSKATDTIFIANNVDYIEELERGSSRQAPAGMFAITIRAFRRYLRAARQRVKKR